MVSYTRPPTFLFTRYSGGGHLGPHVDGVVTGEEGAASVATLLVYVNDRYEGGETALTDWLEPGGGRGVCPGRKRRRGDAVVLAQDVMHEGRPVTAGTKYVLRGDIMETGGHPADGG